MARLVTTLAVVMILLGCSSKQIAIEAQTSLLKVSPDIEVSVTGLTVNPKVLDELARHLKAGLIIAGFDIKPPAQSVLSLRVEVRQFDPGNAALRLAVGFGAGRGSLLYTARYLGREGKVLAEMDGEERFTGSEVHFNMEYGQMSTLGGAEKVRSVLVQEAAKHIVELGLAKRDKQSKKSRERRR